MKKLSKILFFLLMALLVAPMLQQSLEIVKTGELHGSAKKVNMPALNVDNWFSEKFQSGAEKYLARNFGFFSWFIRVENQIQYSFFDKAKANGVIIGKEKYLYEKSYIDAYYGDDYLGDSTINSLYSKLKKLSDTLEKHNTKILVVFAPGKGSFFPQYIPEKLISTKGQTNLEVCVKIADSLKLNYIDMSSWFIEMKDTATYPLYPKTGIHWSYYGVSLAADSIVSYCKNRLGLTLSDINWSAIEMNRNLKGPDNDIEKGMNLIFDLPNHEMPYLKIESEKQANDVAQSIVIADSYYWQLFNLGFSTRVFREGQFWFYSRQVFPKINNQETWVKDLNFKQELINQDIIILLTTEPVLKREYWGFVDKAFNAFYNPENKDLRLDIENQAEKIRKNKTLMKMIKEKAEKRNISIDSMIMLDAEYIIKSRRRQ